MLPRRLTTELSELRLDLQGADTGKVRLGLTVTVAIVVVTASGWPPGDPMHRTIFLVLGALPTAAVGMGLILSQLIETRAERNGARLADHREVEALRARIRREAAPDEHPAPPELTPRLRYVPRVPGAGRSSSSEVGRRGRPLIGGRRRGGLLTRSGILRLR